MRPAPLMRNRLVAPPRQKLGKRCRLHLERLEDRTLLDSAYAFSALQFLGDDAPGGGEFVFDFEPGDINNGGTVVYGADIEVDGEEGEAIFLQDRSGNAELLARFGDEVPGLPGRTYGPFFAGPPAINNPGDAAFIFETDLSVGPNFSIGSVVFRYSHQTGEVTPVFDPGVTEAPGGGTFVGANIRVGLNDAADLVFAGIVEGGGLDIDPTMEPGVPGEDRGSGIFLQDRLGNISEVVVPGDTDAEGRVFDFAENPSINNRGDVAFGGHTTDLPCLTLGALPEERLFCAESVYLKTNQGEFIAIARQGEAVPDSAGGGTYLLAFGPVVNESRQVVFIGDLSPDEASAGTDLGVFLWDDGETIAVARPGDQLPGGTMVTASFFIGSYDINNRGDVTFGASLDTDDNGTIDATGIFKWSRGEIQVVAMTGTEIPGIGTVEQILPPDFVTFGIFPDFWPYPFIGGTTNDAGQVFFTAAVDTGGDDLDGLLLVASPAGRGRSDVVVSSTESSSLAFSSSSGATSIASAAKEVNTAGLDALFDAIADFANEKSNGKGGGRLP